MHRPGDDVAARWREDSWCFPQRSSITPERDDGRRQLIGDIEQRPHDLDPILPTYFGHLPTQKLLVQPVPGHTQATSPGGYYYPPAMDGSRPGTFFINLGDIRSCCAAASIPAPSAKAGRCMPNS